MTARHRTITTLLRALLVAAGVMTATATDGPVAEWKFDEGRGEMARDTSGNGHDAKVHGPSWVRQGSGFALSFDGYDDYVDCSEIKSLVLKGPFTIEAWVRPTRKAHGETCLFGESMSSYLVTYYNTEIALIYIGSGANNARGALSLGEWNHTAASFDGDNLTMCVNGRVTDSHASQYKTYEPAGQFVIGTKGQPHLPKFKGMIDNVRIYDRALSPAEVVAHFRSEAAEHGFDPEWFSRVRVKPYCYADRGQIVVEADYERLLPLSGRDRLKASLSQRERPDTVLVEVERTVDGVPGTEEIILPSSGLAAGEYSLRVVLEDGNGPRPTEEVVFVYPPRPAPVPSPAEAVVPPLPPARDPGRFGFQMAAGGGFLVTVKGARYAVESRVSWPGGDFNRLTASDRAYDRGEKSWNVTVRRLRARLFQVAASGDFYSVERQVEVFPTHVYVRDTYTNLTDRDLGLLIYNEIPLSAGQVTGSWLSGHDRRGRQAELPYPDYGPSMFFTDATCGVGMVPVDDVYVVQAVPYVDWNGAAGVGTEKFALPPHQSYTLEWAVYPTRSGDYYDFVNAFRKAEGRIGTVPHVQGFIGRRSLPTREQVKRLRLQVAIIPSISNALDDPNLYIEGIEFMDFPKEMAFLKQQAADSRRQFPGLKVVFHIAHSLYCTDKPDRFADSKVIAADGRQATWGDGSTFGAERQAARWRWWIFYPTPGNSFHDAMMKSVDVMMDKMGMDGGFMDGFLAGYCGQWSYDTDLRWDGHSAEIDPVSKTIRRKMNSVLLLSQPSMIAYARRIRDKGGVVLVNGCVFTRSICNEKYLVFDNECASGPELHLAPTVMALASPWGPVLRTERDVYLDILDKLRWGELWFSYGEPYERFSDKSSPTLAAFEFPMTFEEIRPGMVKGPERIVTMNDGIYGWPADPRLHAVHKFDARGALVPNDFVTTLDHAGARTELKLARDESAVIEPIPVFLETAAPVNVRVVQYDERALRLFLNGSGAATLRVTTGAFPVSPGVAYRVVAGDAVHVLHERDGALKIPLEITGPMELAISRADEGT